MSAERRQAPRIKASLEMQFEGERRAKMRSGDISVTGALIDLPGYDAAPGRVVRLKMASRDKEQRVEVAARVVRVSSHGAAFQFLPAGIEEREALAMLFVHVARSQIRRTASGVRPRSEPPASLGVRSLSVETEWKLRAGERVVIELPTPEGGSVRFEGEAVRCRASRSGTFRTTVETTGFAPAFTPANAPTTEAVTLVNHPAPDAGVPDGATMDGATDSAAPSNHLRGDLERVRAPSLLSLAAMERMSGTLVLTQTPRSESESGVVLHPSVVGARVVTVYIRDGQVVDVEEPGSNASRRRLVGEICHWDHGSFEMQLGPVERPDGIGVPTSALLLQLARFHDESHRHVA